MEYVEVKRGEWNVKSRKWMGGCCGEVCEVVKRPERLWRGKRRRVSLELLTIRYGVRQLNQHVPLPMDNKTIDLESACRQSA